MTKTTALNWKKTTILLVFILGACFVFLENVVAQSTSNGEFKFEAESHNFGKLKQHVPVDHEFVFTNSGTEPIIITQVRPSCGCSVAEFPKTPIKPGEKASIKVTFDAAAKGPFTKHLTVRSNSKTPVRTLVIRGEVTE